MKIAVINGNARHGSTWNCKEALINELKKQGDVDTVEFTLPRDLPHFCNGCFSCICHGEETCPHASYVRPIVEAMAQADLIILTSPVYGMDVSGQMKALIDHLCFMWMSHRPDPRMFSKLGVVVSTTAGAGLGHTVKTMKNSLTFWGVKRIYTLRFPVSAMEWDGVNEKAVSRIHARAKAVAGQIRKAAKRGNAVKNTPFQRLMFAAMVGMMKKNAWNPCDRAYWEAQGWLNGGAPY